MRLYKTERVLGTLPGHGCSVRDTLDFEICVSLLFVILDFLELIIFNGNYLSLGEWQGAGFFF